MAQLLHLESENPDKDISDLHQLAGRDDHRAVRDLRHDAVHQERHRDDLHGSGRIGRGGPARVGDQGEAARAAALPCAAAPAVRRRGGSAVDDRDPAREILRMRDMLDAILAETDRPAGRAHPQATPTATSSWSADEALEYGLIDADHHERARPSRRRSPPSPDLTSVGSLTSVHRWVSAWRLRPTPAVTL